MFTHYALVPNIWKYSHYGRGLLFVFADAYILDMWDCQLILQFLVNNNYLWVSSNILNMHTFFVKMK